MEEMRAQIFLQKDNWPQNHTSWTSFMNSTILNITKKDTFTNPLKNISTFSNVSNFFVSNTKRYKVLIPMRQM